MGKWNESFEKIVPGLHHWLWVWIRVKGSKYIDQLKQQPQQRMGHAIWSLSSLGSTSSLVGTFGGAGSPCVTGWLRLDERDLLSTLAPGLSFPLYPNKYTE